MNPSARAGLVALAAALLVSGCGDSVPERATAAEPKVAEVGLVTSLPIVWRESGSVADLLGEDSPPHWVLGALRARGDVHLLDSLADASGKLPLPTGALLVLAQPYPLSPQENVALDNWVRAGGRLLLFADPMLTQDSAYALGDRRRPQDVILLSPILSRWELQLLFDENQAIGEREVQIDRVTLPANLSGTFSASDKGSKCVLAGEGLVADCRVGQGRLIAVADAAVLEDAPAKAADVRESALRWLLGKLDR